MLGRISGAISKQIDQYDQTLGTLDRQEKLCEDSGRNLLIDEAYGKLKTTDNVANMPVVNLMMGKVEDAKEEKNLSKAEKLSLSILDMQERTSGKNNPDGLTILEEIATLQKNQNHKKQYQDTLASINEVVSNTELSLDSHDKPGNLFVALNKIYQHHLKDKDPQIRTDLLERQLYLVDNLTNYSFGGIGNEADATLRNSLVKEYIPQERYKDIERISKELLAHSDKLEPALKLTFTNYVLQSLRMQNKTEEAALYQKQLADGIKEYQKTNSMDKPGELQESPEEE